MEEDMVIYLNDEQAKELLTILNTEDGFGQLPECLNEVIDELEEQMPDKPDERVNYQSF